MTIPALTVSRIILVTGTGDDAIGDVSAAGGLAHETAHVQVRTGDGDDRVGDVSAAATSWNGGANFSEGRAVVRSGAGDDVIGVVTATAARGNHRSGSYAIDTGAGRDRLAAGASGSFGGTIEADGDLIFALDAGRHDLKSPDSTAPGVTVAGALIREVGPGTVVLTGAAEGDVTLRLASGAVVSGRDVAVGGTLTLDAAAGGATVRLRDATFGGFAFAGGELRDAVTLVDATVAGGVTVDGGVGQDRARGVGGGRKLGRLA